jgi:mRNA interferase RelE/StbE
MDLFKIDPKGSVEHDLRKIDRQFIPRILEAIESLSENPFPVQSRKMKGSESSYRLREKRLESKLHYTLHNEMRRECP